MKPGMLLSASVVSLGLTLIVGLTPAQEPAAPAADDPFPPAAESAGGRTSSAVDPPAANTAPAAKTVEVDVDDLEKLTRISKVDKVWIHPKKKYVVVAGEIALVDGQLELFACPKGTKEHESVVAVESRAYIVHAALLAIGAESGRPVQYTPVYLIPTGDVIDVYVLWTDKEGKKHQVRAQEMVRNIQTEKAMTHDWVFGGSGFWVDESTGERHYLGESGELISVSNFPSSTIDVQVKSSQGNNSLLFESFTEHIPPRGTKVHLVLVPRQRAAAPEKKPSAVPAAPAEAEPNPQTE